MAKSIARQALERVESWETKPFVMPTQLAAVGDIGYEIQEQRKALAKVVEAMETVESQCKAYAIENLPRSDANGITGKIATTNIKDKRIIRVSDWEKFWEFIRKDKMGLRFVQRRVSDAPIFEMIEAKKKVPGTEPFTVKTATFTKRK